MLRRVVPLASLLLLSGCLGGPDAAPAVPGPSQESGPVVVAFGDSYTSGTGARAAEAYPARLGEALGVPVHNAGVHGETAGEALRRLERDVLSREPDLVIVEFGVNEAYRGRPVNESIANLDRIVTAVRASGADVVLVGVHFWSFREAFDEGLQNLSRKHGTGLVLDVLDGIVASGEPGERTDASLRSDEFHPNARGYALMAERIRPEVERVLAARQEG